MPGLDNDPAVNSDEEPRKATVGKTEMTESDESSSKPKAGAVPPKRDYETQEKDPDVKYPDPKISEEIREQVLNLENEVIVDDEVAQGLKINFILAKLIFVFIFRLRLSQVISKKWFSKQRQHNCWILCRIRCTQTKKCVS